MSASEFHRPAWQIPLQWPQAAHTQVAARAHSTGRLLKAAILLSFLALTVFDRFGLRLIESYPIHPTLIAIYALVVAMVMAGAAELNPRAALAYFAVVTVAALSFLLNATFGRGEYVSIGSLLLVIVLYAPFVITLRPGAVAPALWRWIVKTYIAFALFLAVAGIAQFSAQFVFNPAWLFDFTPLIPIPIRGSEVWNTVNEAGNWIKSNGFFLREASGLSFEMAFALLCELSLARRKWVMAILGMALVLTYSGSGLLALGVGLLFPLGRRSLAQLMACAVLAVLLFLILGETLNLSYTVDRVDEYKSEKSSAYCRFVQPAVVAVEEIDSDPWTPLLGHGSGTMQKMHNTCETTFGKALFEYGLLGVLAFGALMLLAINRSAAPVRLRVALGVKWLLLGGHLATPEPLLVIYMICAMWPKDTAAWAMGEDPA